MRNQALEFCIVQIINEKKRKIIGESETWVTCAVWEVSHVFLLEALGIRGN